MARALAEASVSIRAGSGETGGGSMEECEGEDPEDSSSRSLDKLTLEASDEPKAQAQSAEEDPLSTFRQQWQRELESSPLRSASKSDARKSDDMLDELDSIEEKAKQLFLRGAESERIGKIYDAVRFYRRAIQLVPDIEFKLHESTHGKNRTNTTEVLEYSESEDEDIDDTALSEKSGGAKKVDLLTKMQQKVSKRGLLCTPDYEPKGTHISQIPAEVMRMLLCWVVSSDLDVVSLERTGSVCRGLYVASRDPEIWRKLCVRTWGLNCGTLKSQWSSWRQMYIQRPRLRLNGCYISKTTYLRHGENSFQDQFYRPWYQVEYYRYLRFFSDGLVLMLTTPEEPATCVSLLNQRVNRNFQGILSGHYRLMADRVILVVKKQPVEKKPALPSNTRFRPRRKDIQDLGNEQTFHLELQIQQVKSRRNWQLQWKGYRTTVHNKNGTESSTTFDLAGTKFPPFMFSEVRSYNAEAELPLSY